MADRYLHGSTQLDNITNGSESSSATNIISGSTKGNTSLQPSDIVNNVTTTTTGKVLDAYQGKVLQDNKINYTDLSVSANVLIGIYEGLNYYRVASNITMPTYPKVVSAVADLPATNDGYLYLVLANGYLYYWSNNAWVQGSQYTTNIFTLTDVTVEED